jgi:hypothetical protein
MKLKQINESGIFYIPAGPDRKGLNPKAQAELDRMLDAAEKRRQQ